MRKVGFVASQDSFFNFKLQQDIIYNDSKNKIIISLTFKFEPGNHKTRESSW